MMFFKMFKKLSENFHVIMADLYGKGRSSRPHFS